MQLLHELPLSKVTKTPNALALQCQSQHIDYAELGHAIESIGSALKKLNFSYGSRVAVYLPKVPEAVISFFAISYAGLVLVPINPILKSEQVMHILNDSGAKLLISHESRISRLSGLLEGSAVEHIILTDVKSEQVHTSPYLSFYWQDLLKTPVKPNLKQTPTPDDLVALLYTSGSTGKPKGVMLSHRNMVLGALSVSEYLENTPSDKLLCVLPFSFDYGFSQLTTAFAVGASVVLLEYLLPIDIVRAIERYQVTGLALVPPVWMQLASLNWTEKQTCSLRYFTNSGGAMPEEVLHKIREKIPHASPILMYGLTEAFRSSYLPVEFIDSHTQSIGKAIPKAELLVMDELGNECEIGVIGELVHCGELVAQGYWQDEERTHTKFFHIEGKGRAVRSGDLVKRDEQGFLYFVSRNDHMIKSSGYRISPTEIEEEVFKHPGVLSAMVCSAPHPKLGQGIVLHVSGQVSEPSLKAFLMKRLPIFMLPQAIFIHENLPLNANGKLDRNALLEKSCGVFEEADHVSI
ncbi:acyl-CoA ligase (AMP-forming), exosortase A system-associated [Paraneptunicella aestuarii]|uniref:acyl-CoA ligase (AMP-forming), exosortase A system-associated n=1 Tax=Paraneptunicella aestuarii TaxID=2831148 RepID=UPI001E5B14ED|nr:acyl-CoA ligase (AMP-forming), exosortase A system-associated [Paraneptunicella aestuarii]UAA39269.1 acyl-CoA ligase (AMP-forming), exosortase A system-associated [Paraneptunicella aestuarii]